MVCTLIWDISTQTKFPGKLAMVSLSSGPIVMEAMTRDQGALSEPIGVTLMLQALVATGLESLHN